MKLCFESADDRAIEEGWPHRARLLDGHPHDKQAERYAWRYVEAIDPVYDAEWPRGVASRVVRAGCITKFRKASVARAALTPAEIAAIASEAEVGADEAIDLVRMLISTSDESYEFRVHDHLYILEAIAGTDRVLTALVDSLSVVPLATRRPKASGTPLDTYTKAYACSAAGMMLRRASGAVAKRARTKLVALAGRVRSAARRNSDWSMMRMHLEPAVFGSKGLAAAGKAAVSFIRFADDPVSALAEIRDADGLGIDVQAARVAGIAALDGLWTRKYLARELPGAVRDFGMIRADAVVEFMVANLAKKTAAEAVQSWLEEHAAYARPILQRLSVSGELASNASLALRAIGGAKTKTARSPKRRAAAKK